MNLNNLDQDELMFIRFPGSRLGTGIKKDEVKYHIKFF
ncbi:Uncharacterized protein dnl_63830 [Desulfonema limicola]|uniref:Uncharacterized protein n=1 Tax=Desulfonema limicola TaxID=45656 RepID=A0A975BEK9_9BACT|nr:Uncharacterized protein dnl_63830 [Desulfonema limicola]